MTKYELLKYTVGCRPLVINTLQCLEQDLNEAQKLSTLPYSASGNVGYKGANHFRKKVKHYKQIINDLKLIVSETYKD